VISRPDTCGAFLGFLRMKKATTKIVVANFILPLILQVLGTVFFH